MHDAQRLFRNALRHRDLQRVIVHQNDIRRFDGGIRPHGSHGNADIRAGKYGGIVDAVTDKGQFFMLVFLTQEFFDFRHFILRQQLTVDGIEAELARDLVCHALRIAGQHDGFSDAIPVQSLDGLGRMFLDDIRDYDVAGVFPIDSHMDNRAGLFARMPGRTDILHHFLVADTDDPAVDMCAYPAAGNFLHILNPAVIGLMLIGIAQRYGNRMRRKTFDMRREVQELLRIDGFRMNGRNFKNTFGQGSCLIKDNRIDICQRFHVI